MVLQIRDLGRSCQREGETLKGVKLSQDSTDADNLSQVERAMFTDISTLNAVGFTRARIISVLSLAEAARHIG